jgi:Na+/proline symporter
MQPVVILSYIIIGLIIGSIITDKYDNNRDENIVVAIMIWPIIALAFIIAGIYEGIKYLIDFLKSE